MFNEVLGKINNAIHNKLPITDFLIELPEISIIDGAYQNNDGTTDMNVSPLACACIVGNVKAIKELLEFGASVNTDGSEENNNGLLCACVNGHAECVEFLLQHGADANVTMSRGLTPLMASCRKGDLLSATSLLNANALIDASNDTGHTALMIATLNNYHDCVRLLIERNADTSIVNRRNKTAYQLATRSEIREIYETFGCYILK
jgi:hypothetical protein